MPHLPLPPDFGATRTDIPALLRSLRGRDVWYCANPGNAGDAVIAAATRQLFRRAGLAVREVRLEDPIPPGRTVLYGGGGNLVPAYPHAAEFIARHHGAASRFILLPHTVRGHEALLGQLGPNVLLLCRDLPSLEHARLHAPGAQSAPADDLALGLDPSALWCDAAKALLCRPFSKKIRRLFKAACLFGLLPKRRLCVMRADCESASGRTGGKSDLSALLATDVHAHAACNLAAGLFLLRVALSREVETDRLHVGLCGALLGRQVRLHDNSYGKNGAVWAASLRGIYPRVTFVPAAGMHAPLP